MKKTNFDVILNDNIQTKTKKDEAVQIKEQFKTFIAGEIPNEVNAYKWQDKEVLLKVFKYIPEDDNVINITETQTSELQKARYFSFAKVLATGPDSKYKPGEIVKLKDIDTLSIENSKYKQWKDNPLSKSNLEQKGKEPLRYMSNIFERLGPFTFVLNPFDVEKLDSGSDDCIYKLSDGKIENPIADVNILL